MNRLQINKSDFYYIADSALFSEENIAKMKSAEMKFITRIPDNVKEARALIENWFGENGKNVVYHNAHNEDVSYIVEESSGVYHGHDLKYAVVYSTAIEPAKVKSTEKKVQTEKDRLDKETKNYQKRIFACREDAEREKALIQDKKLLKTSFHCINIVAKPVEKKRRGRPSLDTSKNPTITEYQLCITYQQDDALIKEHIRRESTFVLTSNDLELSAEAMLLEYKTQSNVEKRFQQLKNPHFINSLYLNKP